MFTPYTLESSKGESGSIVHPSFVAGIDAKSQRPSNCGSLSVFRKPRFTNLPDHERLISELVLLAGSEKNMTRSAYVGEAQCEVGVVLC